MDVRVGLWRRLSAKELMLLNCGWRRLLRVTWMAMRLNQSILKENQSWTFIGRTDAETEDPILWLPNVKSWLIGKDPDTGKDWRQKKEMTEEEMVGWHHWLDEHDFEQAPRDGEGPGNLACCSPWGNKESDMTKQLKNNNSKEKNPSLWCEDFK